MSPEEIEATVSRAVAKTLDAKLGQFAIDREQHYLDHKFVADLRRLLDDTRLDFCRAAIRWILRALLIAAALGALVLGREYLK
jgi:hypothetical protein